MSQPICPEPTGKAPFKHQAPGGAPAKAKPTHIVWDAAVLGWRPNDQTVTARFEGKNAECKGKGLIPESMHKKLFDRRKPVTARIEVEPVGNGFRIVKVEAPN